jgi:two-component system OmpR family response regulator
LTTAGTGRPRFAIVDDEPFMAELVSDMLLSVGADVEVFHLGADLFKRANLQQFSAIVLDLSLPDMDGFEIMDQLATDSHAISILLMSGHDLAVVRAAKIYGNGLGLNVRGTLTKPFSRDELLTALGLPP